MIYVLEPVGSKTKMTGSSREDLEVTAKKTQFAVDSAHYVWHQVVVHLGVTWPAHVMERY